MSFRIRILTPAAVAFDAEADGVIAPGTDGFFGVLTGHEPALAALAAGVLVIRQAGHSLYFALGVGAAEITPGTLTLYTEYLAPAEKKAEAEEKIETYLMQMAIAVPSAAGTE